MRLRQGFGLGGRLILLLFATVSSFLLLSEGDLARASVIYYNYFDKYKELSYDSIAYIGVGDALEPAIFQHYKTPSSQQMRFNTSQSIMQVIVPLYERGIYLGDVEIRIGTDDDIEVAADQIFEVIGRSANVKGLKSLQALAEPGKFLPLLSFSAIGYPIIFDSSALNLSIEIPIEARLHRSIGLSELDREIYGEFASVESFTAYLNVRSSVDYLHEAGGVGFGDAHVLVDGAARFGKLVLENDASWSSGHEGFRRNGTRFVYDDVNRLHRWVAGDLRPQGRGFQAGMTTAGVSVERVYGLMDPQRNVTPRGGRSFTLEREATVEAYVNGRIVRTLRLQPGTYNVSDFPFVQGSNDINLVVDDDTGRREILSFSLFMDRTQLATGLAEYGLYAGVATYAQQGYIDYSDEAVFSGFYRRGLKDSLTLGVNFQYQDGGSLVGGEWIWGSRIGSIGGDIAFSHLNEGGGGWGVNISYERLNQAVAGGGSFSAALEARSRRFGSPSQFAPDNRYSLNASVSYNRSFQDRSFIGTQVRYAVARDDFDDEINIRLTYGRRVSDRTNVIMDTEWSRGGFSDGFGARVAMVHRFGETGSARAEYDSVSERGRLGYQTSGGRGVGAWSASGSLDGNVDNLGFNGSAAYAANRVELGLAHSTAYSFDNSDVSNQRTSIRGATAIAYAGGSFAIGRPVTDSFAIVKPYAGGRRIQVEVEPNDGRYYARSGTLGPALYGQIGSYSPRSITYDAPEAPAGFDLGSGATRVMPPYRSGVLAVVGSDYGTTVLGRLLNHQGEPVTFMSGIVIEQGGANREVELFTNRSGAFGVSGLKPGHWRIALLGGLVYDLMVLETPEGIVRVGELKPVE